MPELTDVLGTVLRDVAHSRVISDLFSRDVSVEYEKDPILIDFPVPRVEIREASIQLQFAVNAVERREVGRDGIIGAQVSRHAAELGQQIHTNIFLKHPNWERLREIIEEKELPDKIEQAMLSNPQAVTAALENRPQALTRVIQKRLGEALREDDELWEVMKKGMLVREIRERVAKDVSAMVTGFIRDVSADLGAAERQALSVDVAVTRKELLDIPEAILSNISVVTEIRNYEWTEVGEVDEQPVRRLRPE